MIQSVTPWAATVQSDIASSKPLWEKQLNAYTLRLYNTGDSIWLTVQWPQAGQIAFRLAFGMNSDFDLADVNESGQGIMVTASTRLGSYQIAISFPQSEQTLLRYTTTFKAALPLRIPFWPRDIVPLTKEGRTENTAGIIHAHQVGGRSGQIFFSLTRPKTGSVFYFQNLSAMSDYCEVSETTLVESVGGQWPEIGFQFPVNKEKPIPADVAYTISDAFVVLSEEIPEKDCQVAAQFLDSLAAVYLLLPKPETPYNDWPGIAEKVIGDLYHNKGCWTQTDGLPFLNAYVCDYKTPAEIMVQLAVKLPLVEYLEWCGKKHPLYEDLNSGLEDFYDERVQSIVRWHPSLEDDLDKSEEQKQEMVMDSWYLHHPLLNLSRLALKGDKIAEKLFLESIDYAIKVAHHFDYQWPVFYKMTTLEVLKAETQPGNGGEKDVPGSYAHIMLMAWKLTGEKRYLNEAAKAVKLLGGLCFDIFYQANNTAFTAGALVELYKETGDKRLLELSYCCLSGIFKNCQIWDCGYGFGKNFPNFFSVFPLNDAPYTAAYEELEVYAALYHYLLVADGIEILPSLNILIPEFIRYAIGRMAFYYPPLLPQEMIAEEIKTGEIQKDLWIPLEDLHDGWEKNGEVGQEVYGAGLPFGIVPRQYFALENGAMLFVDYPVMKFRKAKSGVTFHIIGDESMYCTLRILAEKPAVKKVSVNIKKGKNYEEVPPVTNSEDTYQVPAGSAIKISWTK